MKINKDIINAALSVEVILLAFILGGFVALQAFYPKHSALQALALLITVLFIRIAFKISESKGDTQIIEK